MTTTAPAGSGSEDVRDARPGRAAGAGRPTWAGLGLACTLAGLGVAEVLAAFLGPSSSPLVAVSAAFVDRTPPWLKDFATNTFGTADKLVLLTGAALVLAGFAAATGLVARRRPGAAGILALALGAVAALAAATRPTSGVLSVVPSLAAALVAAFGLNALASRLAPAGRELAPADPARRGVLRTGAVLAAGGAAALAAGRVLQRVRGGAEQSRAAVRLPAPARPAGSVAGAQLAEPGISPFRVPNAEFYRIDTALVVPEVQTRGWTLRIHGMVQREVTLGWDQLMAAPLVERDVTLTCVSNDVGGGLIGNARWLGMLLKPLLERAGPTADADMVLSTSADGWTAGTPLQVLLDGRDAMLAIGMNGEPLPLEHGFPVRMVVPGLYGYVSGTKWVTDLKVTRFDQDAGYWTPRGWAPLGPIKTSSRIDVPADGASVRAGRVVVAGVAWAQHRGIRAVEVRALTGAGDEPWTPATLGREASVDAWREWSWAWRPARPGTYRLQVRATDGTGRVQDGTQRPPAPDGATGWHTIQVEVTG